MSAKPKLGDEGNNVLKKTIGDEGNNVLKKTIDDLNTLIFEYASQRLPYLNTILSSDNANNSDESLYEADSKLLSVMYSIIFKLATFYKDKYETIITVTFKDPLLNAKINDFFNKYNESSVISYIKIRDGFKEEEDKYKLFNPRYIYYTDKTTTDIDDNGEKLTLGLDQNSPSATLSLFYCNDPSKKLIIPEYYLDWEKKLDADKSKITEADSVIENLNYELLNYNQNSNVFPKYDHLFHYGHFNKILYNSDNESFGNNMTEVKDKLIDNQDVFIIGYGASGAGKTTTLIYDKNNKKNQDGAVVFMLNSLAEKKINFKKINLTINELFMDKPTENINPENIYPTILTKISKQEFTYDMNSRKFNGSIFTKKYLNNMKDLNAGITNNEGVIAPEYSDLFLKEGNDSGMEYLNPLDRTDDGGANNSKIEKTFSLSIILQLLIGKKRKVSGTTNNPQSSRSHVLTTIEFPDIIKNKTTNETLKLYIGDFAGVENKFDYISFNYNNNIDEFKSAILTCIYKLEGIEGTNEYESNSELMTYSKKFKPIIAKTQDEITADNYLLKLENINMLISSIYLLKPELLGKTIKDYAFLKHPKEKYKEIYENENENENEPKKWADLNNDEKIKFDDTSLVYFYQLLSKPGENYNKNEEDNRLKLKVKEMIPMIKFLCDENTGYNEEYNSIRELANFSSSNSRTFEPTKKDGKTPKQINLDNELTDETKTLNKQKAELNNVKIKYGLNDPFENFKEDFIESNGNEKGLTITNDQTQINFPAANYNLNIKRNNIRELVKPATLLPGFNAIDIEHTNTSISKEVGNFTNISATNGNLGRKEFGKQNRIFKQICTPIIDAFFLNPTKYLDGSTKYTFPPNGSFTFPGYKLHAGQAYGRFFEKIRFVLDEDLNFKILDYVIADSTNFISAACSKNLGLVSYVARYPDGFNDDSRLRELLIESWVNEPNLLYKEMLRLAGNSIRQMMELFVKKRFKIAEDIKKNFNSMTGENRNAILFLNSKGPIPNLSDEVTKAEELKDFIRPYTESMTEEFTKNIEETNKRIAVVEKDIIQSQESSKYTMIAEAVIKRIFHIHYEVVKRTFEGLFINKSLQEMRFTMTDVLKATNELNGVDTRLVPNFNSKCSNYYSNVLLENIFEPNTNTDDVNIANTNRFNIIHQILVKNKSTESSEDAPYTINKSTITDKLKGGIVYCVCLLLNNSYQETQNFSYVNNPPKIPYIDLTEAYTELNRFRKKNMNLNNPQSNPKNLVFQKFYSDKDKKEEKYLLTEYLRNMIEEITGFTYDEFTNKNFHIDIFENINTYMEYCYNAAVKNGTISNGKIIEINNKFKDLKKLSSNLASGLTNNSVTTKDINTILKAATDYLFLIEIMNGTSVIGTIDFADEISKYNLSYNKCSVSQININYKSKQQLYSSDYDYLEKFRKFYSETTNMGKLGVGVHAYVPPTAKVRNQVWRNFILPSLLNLDKGDGIYKNLIKNKMKDLKIKDLTGKILKIEYQIKVIDTNREDIKERIEEQEKYMQELKDQSKNGDVTKNFIEKMNTWREEKATEAEAREAAARGAAAEVAAAEARAAAKEQEILDADKEIEQQRQNKQQMAKNKEINEKVENKLNQMAQNAAKHGKDSRRKIANEMPFSKDGKGVMAGIPPYLTPMYMPNPRFVAAFQEKLSGSSKNKWKSILIGSDPFDRSPWPNIAGKYNHPGNQNHIDAIMKKMKGGNKTKKYSKLKLKQPKKIERKYKQSLKNKIKVNHSQVNRFEVLNKTGNNKTKKYMRLKLKEKKKVEKKYKQSFKNKKY